MTIAEQLEAETAGAPRELVSRMLEALDAARTRYAGAGDIRWGRESTRLCLASAEVLLDEFLRSGGMQRREAVDLLAADALVTYGFMVASAHTEDLRDEARRSLARIAALSEKPGMGDGVGGGGVVP
ncbi:MAG: hypothetical protein ABR543_07355 [Gemmatimonadaceae bacterium]